ncbi:MAG TPA: hypothetical protein VII66_02520, partial [Gemmatimonadaceae bacterium]
MTRKVNSLVSTYLTTSLIGAGIVSAITAGVLIRRTKVDEPLGKSGHVIVHHSIAHDVSGPLATTTSARFARVAPDAVAASAPASALAP